MKLRLKELEIESDLEGAIRIGDFRLVQELNGQPRLTVKFLMEEHTAAELVRRASDIAVTVREHAFTGGRVVFSGKAEELWTATEKGVTYLWLDAYPYTREWERTEKSRSFLNASMTYMDVAEKVLSDYGQADIRDEVTGGALIPGMLLQYEESDWAFLRRLASHFGTCLIADCTDAFGRVYFGIPHMHYGTALTSGAYTLEKDLLHYDKVLMPQGILSQEVSRWKVRTRRFLSMGEEITLNRIPVVVTGQCIRLEKGELVYGYELSRRVGIRVEQEKNSRISGMSIPATVKERSGNRIRVQFDIDKEYDPAGRFSPMRWRAAASTACRSPKAGSISTSRGRTSRTPSRSMPSQAARGKGKTRTTRDSPTPAGAPWI